MHVDITWKKLVSRATYVTNSFSVCNRNFDKQKKHQFIICVLQSFSHSFEVFTAIIILPKFKIMKKVSEKMSSATDTNHAPRDINYVTN